MTLHRSSDPQPAPVVPVSLAGATGASPFLRPAGQLLARARVPRRAAVLTKEGLFAAGVTGVVFAGPDDGGAWRTTLAEGPGGGIVAARQEPSVPGAGVIVIEGAIEQRAQYGMCEAFVDGYDAIEARYDVAIEAYKAGEISKIVTVINSPGGVRQGLFSTARRVRQKIEAAGVPTMAVADEEICSAAWVWALVSDKLYAPPDGKVGSIGAVTIAESIAGKLEKEGREIRVYRSGERKMRPSGVEPFTDEDDKELQARADSGGELIAEWTAERRGGSKDDYLALRGAVFSGQEAARRGLIDGLMSAHEVVEMALKDAEHEAIAKAHGLTSLASAEQIIEKAQEGTAAIAALSAAKAQAAKAEAERIALEERTAREKALQEAAAARSKFAADVKAACDAAKLTPTAEAALLVHYDKHGEASARDTFEAMKASAPLVNVGKPGGGPVPSDAKPRTLTDAQKAHAKAIGVSEDDYAAHVFGAGKDV